LVKEYLTIKPGQKFRHRRKEIIYTVKSVRRRRVVLVSENGESGMRIQKDSLASAEFEPIHD